MALAAIVSCVGLAMLPPATPSFVRSVAGDAGLAARTGLSRDAALATAERVRASVLTADPAELPALVEGRTGFDDRAIGHLTDVRSVLRGGLVATVLALVALLATVAWGLGNDRVPDVAAGLRSAGWVVMVSVLVVGAASAVAPEVLFTGFHRLLFDSGTWLFPQGDLLIALFPPTYWALSAAAWGLGVVLCGIVLLGASRALMGRTASAMGRDV